MKKLKTITGVLIAVTFLISIVGILFLPEQIAVQWNDQGVSNVGSKYILLYLPVISLVLCLVYMSIAKTLRYIIPLLTAAFILICEAVILVNAFGIVNITHIGSEGSSIWAGRIINIIVGILVVIIGNRLPKFVMNYYIGVKSPWALTDSDSWIKTQRFAGKVWFVIGLVLIVLAFMPAKIKYAGRILCFVAMIVLPRIYSFKLYDKKKQ